MSLSKMRTPYGALFTIIFLQFWACFFVTGLQTENQTEAPTYSLDQCKPINGMSRQQCEKRILNGCSELLQWVGSGCTDLKGKRLRDGGCQSLADGKYCKYRCKSRCVDNSFCMWINGKGCRYRGCGGLDLFDRSPPTEFLKGVLGFSSTRTQNWAQDGIGLRLTLAQNILCGTQLYIVSSRDPDTNQLSQVEVRVYQNQPTSFADIPISVVQLYLVKALARGRLANSALKWYSLRYELSEHIAVMQKAGPAHILLRFPLWTGYAFSLLTSSSPMLDELNHCAYSLGNSTRAPISTCNSAQRDSRLFIKVFA